MDKESKTRKLNTSISEVGFNHIKEMTEFYGIAVAEVIRRGLDDLYEKMLKVKFGYKGALPAGFKLGKNIKEAQREEIIGRIRAMNPEELTKWLIERNYFKFYEPADNVLDYIGLGEQTQVPTWIQETLGKDGNVVSRREIFNLDELIGDLKKHKFI